MWEFEFWVCCCFVWGFWLVWVCCCLCFFFFWSCDIRMFCCCWMLKGVDVVDGLMLVNWSV